MINYVIFSSLLRIISMLFLINKIFYSLIFLSMSLLLLFLTGLIEGFVIDRYFYYDRIGIVLVILSVWVRILILYSRYKIKRFKEFFNTFSFLVIGLILILCISFFCGGYLIFYFFFEVSLIPTLLIIIGWGYQPERFQSGIYFLFYTLTASLPLLLLIVYMNLKKGGLSFFFGEVIYTGGYGVMSFILIGLIGIIAFIVKLPIYYVHL